MLNVKEKHGYSVHGSPKRAIIVRLEECAVTIVITLETKGGMTKMLMHRTYQTKAHI